MASSSFPCIQILFLIINSSIFVHSWCFQSNQNEKFKQKTNKFWEFEQHTQTWVEINLPYDLKSCINDTCTKVGSIENQTTNEETNNQIDIKQKQYEEEQTIHGQAELPIRRRVSLNRMSESSVWVTGQSGSIFERFWNGVQWVIAPHELPSFAGFAVSTFIVNQTILSLSENGILYQLQLNENSQPFWSETLFVSGESNTNREEMDQIQIKSGAVSHDGKRLFLSSMNGSLIEISEFQPFRWENHGRPLGGDVASISDTGSIKSGVLFTISSNGDLYEFDKQSKPSWKKHISTENISLKPFTGSVIHGLFGSQSISIFLINKDGFLVERRLHRRKWKWSVHGTPKNRELSSITPIYRNPETDSRISSLFFTTTSTGFVFEYQLPVRPSGGIHGDGKEGIWINHNHPKDAKIAQSISGVQLQIGRTMFPLDDGRLAELHLPGLGGDESGPNPTISTRRKQISNNKYEWSVLDTPESEGWNGEYCTEDHGPMNCILGSKTDLHNQLSPSRRRTEEEKQSNYISTLSKTTNYQNQDHQPNNLVSKSIESNFKMRVMHSDRSLFLITENGMTFEYLLTNGVWLWLRHEHGTSMTGALGSYNGSLYVVDLDGNLFIRERVGEELSWINCTGLEKGRHVASGAPWDGNIRLRGATSDDALFFVNKKGKLLQFTVASRAFKWKDCQNPPETKIAFIIDQEILRRNIVFVIGRNNRLYQYNKITELWHEHSQSPHLMLSLNPGTAMRPYQQSLAGSLFMVSVHGGLIEYRWTNQEGWEWVEHGGPKREVELVMVGPGFDGKDLFVIGNDGFVYRRSLDNFGVWRWVDHGYPNANGEGPGCNFEGNVGGGGKFSGECNEKVAAVRPIPFSDHSVIFELQDGRLGELRRQDESGEFEWSRMIGTPTSKCMTSYWTAVAT
ncbi:hypothetical protein LUZ60_004000 [Juncus effusus]|nr:hypothetical protein LUZ60_004000 [Juncus effusus]